MDIVKSVKKIEREIIDFRRELHRIPEMGLTLPKTVRFVKEQLDFMGIEYYTLIDGNAVVGIIKGSEEGKTVALRGDMDALEIEEETGLHFASENGCMHACGHDGHTAALLGAAKVLNDNRDAFKGNIKLLFQPGEESPGGAKPMIDEGALENPKVDRIFGMHMGDMDGGIPLGNIGVNYGTMMAAVDSIKIKIKGKGSHAAYPHNSIDPILTAAEIAMSIQGIVSREIDPVEPTVISVTRIDGGTTHNIIPNFAELEGTVRTTNEETRKRVEKRIGEVVQGISLARGAAYEYEYIKRYPSLVNTREVTEEFIQSAEKIIGRDNIQILEKPSMGAEDMSFFLREVPGTFFYLSNLGKIDGVVYPHHNPKFDLDESEIWKGVAIMVQATVDYLNS